MARDRSTIAVNRVRRRQQSKFERERKTQRALVIAGTLAILLIIAIPAFGYWSNFIAPPRSVILQVDDSKYTLGLLTRYIKGIQAMGAEANLASEPFNMLTQFQQNEFVKSWGRENSVEIDESALEQEIMSRIIDVPENPSDSELDQLQREFNEAYQQFLDTSNLTEAEHRDFVTGSMLRDRLTDRLAEDIPSHGRQADLSWIVIPTNQSQGDDAIIDANEKIEQVDLRLKAGEDFALLAEEFSEDRDTAVRGGHYGWVPEGIFGALDSTIFALEPGVPSDKVDTGETIYFFQVSEYDEDREVTAAMQMQLTQNSVSQWMIRERGNHRITTCFGSGSKGEPCDWQYDWLVKQVRSAAIKAGLE